MLLDSVTQKERLSVLEAVVFNMLTSYLLLVFSLTAQCCLSGGFLDL